MPSQSAQRSGWPRSSRGWKDIQSKRQIAKKTKLALMVLAAVLTLLLLAKGIKFTQMLFSPWRESPTSKNYIWNGDFNINILLKSKSISLISYSPKNEKVTLITIPDTTFIEVPHGFGSWQLRSIYDLGGTTLLKDSLTNFFALPIDGFMEGDLVAIMSKNPLSIFGILPSLKTDLTPFELIRLKIGLSQVRFDKIKQIDLEKTGLLEKNNLPDGTLVYTADPVKLDSLLSDMIDPQIAKDKKTIAIFNSTGHPQLAQKAVRLVANLGGDVIIVSNGQKNIDKTQVVGEKSKTLERLQQIFDRGGNIGEDLVSSRAQIDVFLGEDYFNKF